eukprot:14687776-Alexandrium_andersonii.AAC.1
MAALISSGRHGRARTCLRKAGAPTPGPRIGSTRSLMDGSPPLAGRFAKAHHDLRWRGPSPAVAVAES